MVKDSNRRVQCLLINSLIYGIFGVMMLAFGVKQVTSKPFYVSLIGTHVHEVSVYFCLIGAHAAACSIVLLLLVNKRKEETPKLILPCFVVVFCILAFAGGIGACVYQKTLPYVVKTSLDATLPQYTSNSRVAAEWDVMQTQLKCCGINGSLTWRAILGDVIPDTCCATYTRDCGRGPMQSQSTIKYQGCFYATVKDIQYKASILAYMGISVAFIQISILTLSFWYAGSI